MRHGSKARTAAAILAGVLSLGAVACSDSDDPDAIEQEVDEEIDEERDEIQEEIDEEKEQITDG